MPVVVRGVAFPSMLARRLMIAMLVMLGLASLSAALVPVPEEREERSTTAAKKSERAREGAKGPGGRLVRAELDAQAQKPRAVRLQAGDQLALRVDSDQVLQVEIPEFGQLADVQPGGPARFDLLATRPGAFSVRVVRPARTIGRIEVEEAAKSKPG